MTSGKIVSGTFSSTGGCNGLLAGTTSPVKLTVSWKGKSLAGGKATINESVVSVNGAAPSFGGSNVGFELPNPTPGGGTITGSLAGYCRPRELRLLDHVRRNGRHSLLSERVEEWQGKAGQGNQEAQRQERDDHPPVNKECSCRTEHVSHTDHSGCKI